MPGLIEAHGHISFCDTSTLEGLGDIPVVIGGIIPDDDARKLEEAGVRRVYTPKDFDFTRIMSEIVDVVTESNAG